MSISETIEKVVQRLGGSAKFHKTPEGKDLYINYTGSVGHEFYLNDSEVSQPPYTIFIGITADGVSDGYIIPIKNFAQSMGKVRGNDDAFEAFIHTIFASIF